MASLLHQADAQEAHVRPRLSVCRENIAPTDNQLALECDELTKIVGDDVSIERERLFERRRLQKGEKALLARNSIKRPVQALKV